MTGELICGIDTGGTFTDCVVVDADGGIVTAKAPSTPGDFSQGVLDSLAIAADKLGLTTEALLTRSARLALGTTVGTNALLQRRGAKVGLITTRGHRDVIHIMRGARGVPGLASEKVLHFPESNKPDPPIVPKTWIAEVSERVDCKGLVVVELNEDEAEAAIRGLVAKGARPSRSASWGRLSTAATRLYGAGAGFRETRVEIVTYRVRTTAVSAKPAIRPERERGATPTGDARAGARPVYWAELSDFALTPVWWGGAARGRQSRRGARHRPGSGHDHRRASGPGRADRRLRQRARGPHGPGVSIAGRELHRTFLAHPSVQAVRRRAARRTA